ncbi:hypothetical protein [Burkholderia ubonensis]|uniref:hypothetical protein n=1 Tax=Burkholderia ubonensis TaxID=101571 RepID=UPI000BA74135|nr:hypothetical protein [Burkholderia ubonensis]PAJ83569.1 hypothetical protein CJO70_32640 [Burkholderia ubonensis]PAJ90696.1 hypothetical protein CJO69_31250 [Burkholderia ubonensis]PAK03953.1 hypothetical protein CJO67_31855 [Burkholderia ubonensis]PAK10431.1 hypothetical protein CJO66_33285 [Burkholderia ubonensis]RQP42327.1 hypothetical protein DF155_01920 [Burkholderia ubonensis]
METPWWIGLPSVAVAIFGAYQTYESQKSIFTIVDAQTIAAELQLYKAQSSDGFASLNDKVADTFEISKTITGTIDRSKLTFAPANVHGTLGDGYTITASGLNKGDCLNFEPKGLFDSVTVNGQKLDRSSMTLEQMRDLCHSTLWPWVHSNVVVLAGS